ncbi:MAG TPA: hypothetical protein VNS46_17105 [Nocardioides sp.]|nr:hypothetical protein [Nocardioides sp.]
MSRTSRASRASRAGRRSAPDTPALIDLRVLLVAAVVSAPAAYRAGQGLLTPDQALGRFLVVLLGCTVLLVVLRAAWPLVAGEPAGVETDEAAAETAPEVSPPPG